MHSKISLETIESIKILWPHFKRKVGLNVNSSQHQCHNKAEYVYCKFDTPCLKSSETSKKVLQL